MNSRERVLAAINREPLDRIPTDIWATGEVWEKLRRHFGDGTDIHRALHIDGIASVGARYAGPPLPEPPEGETVDYWGIRAKRVDYGTGAYYEQSFHPLAEARTIDDLERYPWPKADWFDCSEMPAAAKAARETHAVSCGYMAPFYFHNLLRGLETSLVDPLEDAEFTRHLLSRLSDSFYEVHLRMFETCEGLIDTAHVTDDYGSQTGPLIGLKTFREFYKPHLKRFADLCRGFGIKVFHHDDGAIRPFLPDLIEIGIDILNPVQANCPGMEMEGLKRDFGDVLCFHGGIDNQAVLPFGTPEEVRAEVRHAIDALASDRTGYILAPCHNLQPVSPVENILAMYDEAWHYGKF
ncbi:MAG: uroporphyrinogen-III decarboxylase-like protein [Armatimonadetes bacterium]|nr:uroporphyrinogen-III decarboxylase-like protein [Armatimonadota bacterium]